MPISETKKYGIEEINLNKLGQVVAFIGKNGSGKTRALNIINEYLLILKPARIYDGSLNKLPKNIEQSLAKFKSQLQNDINLKILEDYKEAFKKNPTSKTLENLIIDIEAKTIHKTSPTPSSNALNKIRTQISPISQEMTAFEKMVPDAVGKMVTRINHFEINFLQTAIEKDVKTEIEITFEDLIERVTENQVYNEFQTIHKTALNYLNKLPHRLAFDKDDCYGDMERFSKRPSFKRFESLKKYIKVFLGKDLTWDSNKKEVSHLSDGYSTITKGNWKIDERLFNYTELSDGEKTLFAYSLLFFLLDQNPNIKIKECIIFIDEPELHLHPESETAIIDGIREVIKDNGQLWIATHSLSILANLNYDEILLVKKGKVYHPSRNIPGETFIELMGIENKIEKFQHFVSNIFNWAFLNFMEQCFKDPDVIEFSEPNDPEIEVLKASISNKNNNTVLLDFGAGKGRIFNEIFSDENIIMQYEALEPNKELANELRTKGIKKIYSGYESLPSAKFDFVLLCNVLHEIEIDKWINIVNKIIDSIKETGFLIIIEDLLMPKGEMIEKAGFIVLDPKSIQKLFQMKNNPLLILPKDSKYNERIMCAVIPKTNLIHINKGSLTNALKVLKENTLRKIIDVRSSNDNKENDLSNGRKYAFYSQLYINTILAEIALN